MAYGEGLVSIPQIPKKIPPMPAKTGLPGAAKLPGAGAKLGAASSKFKDGVGIVQSAASEVSGAVSGAGQPVAKTSLKDDLKNAAQGGGSTVPGQKQSVRSAGLEAAAQVAKGFATGGAAGAIKSGAVAIVKNKRLRNIVLVIVSLVLVMAVTIPLAQASLVISALSSINANDDATAQSVAVSSGVKSDDLASDIALGASTGIPWSILASVRKQTNAAPDARAIATALDGVDPKHQNRDINAGSTYEEGTGARVVIARDERAVRLAAAVKDTYIKALSLVPGLDATSAEQVYTRASVWALGQEQRCDSAVANNDSGGIDKLTVKGAQMTVEQKVIAKIIIGVTKSLVVGDNANTIRAAEIAVSVGIVENTLKNGLVEVDHDSLGVFQQRANWGSAADRIRPDWATARFLKALTANRPGWNTRDPGEVAQDTQISDRPDEYKRRMPEAKSIVAALWGQTPAAPIPAGFDASAMIAAPGAPASDPGTVCLGAASGTWVAPYVVTPTIYDWFGVRIYNPSKKPHSGIDFAQPAGSPVLSVSSGKVLFASTSSAGGCGYYVQIQHEGMVARYCHFESPPLVAAGDNVVAGQEVGRVGTTGDSGGNHLHFDVTVNKIGVDPVVFMAGHGIDFLALPTAAEIGKYHG